MVPTTVCFPLHEILYWDCLYQVESNFSTKKKRKKKEDNLKENKFYYKKVSNIYRTTK